jgi:hypothetical protein
MSKNIGKGEDRMPVACSQAKQSLGGDANSKICSGGGNGKLHTHSFLLGKQTIVLQGTIVQTLHLKSQSPMGVAKNFLFPLIRKVSSHQHNRLQILPLWRTILFSR